VPWFALAVGAGDWLEFGERDKTMMDTKQNPRFHWKPGVKSWWQEAELNRRHKDFQSILNYA
jgi:hypothetical protein